MAHTHSKSAITCVLVLLLWGTGSAEDQLEATHEAARSRSASKPLRTVIQEGVHPLLRWGRFPDHKQDLERLYEVSDYQLLWSRQGKPTPQAIAAVASLTDASHKGLNASDYDADLMADWVEKLETQSNFLPGDHALFDVALSLNMMRYVVALHIGRIDPSHVNFGVGVQRKSLDLPTIVELLSKGSDPQKDMEQYEPRLWQYKKLQAALPAYRELAAKQGLQPIYLPPVLRPGDRHPGVPKLREFLSAVGDLKGSDGSAPNSALYTPQLVAAVTRFQKRHGLAEDGVVGKNTLTQLNVPISERLKQIQRGLERLRWLPEQFEGAYLIANIPSFHLYGFQSSPHFEKPDLVMKIIVGQAIDKRNTPIFHAEMRYVVFRPYWNIPYSITVKEMLPEIMTNPRYLAKNDLEIVNRFSESAQIFPATPENLSLLRTGALKLRQRPGPKNALGLAKFIFPNHNSVYLHSTPAQQLFSRSRRDFSHGCIRVEDPVLLAEFVLGNEGRWPRERIEKVMKGKRTKHALLTSPIDVYIFYSTVLVDEKDDVLFYEDIYGHDETLQQLLDTGYPFPA